MVEAFDQRKVNGAVPPEAVIKIAPLAPPKQFTLVMEANTTAGPEVLATATAAEAEQPLASVTVTVKEAAASAVAVCVV